MVAKARGGTGHPSGYAQNRHPSIGCSWRRRRAFAPRQWPPARRLQAFAAAHAGTNDLAGPADDALEILGAWRDLATAIGLPALGETVCVYEIQDETSETAGQPGALRAGSRLIMTAGPGFMPASLSAMLAADLGLMSVGDPSLLAAGIPHGGRAKQAALLALLKVQAVKFAHYRAGVARTKWKTEFRRLRPAMGETTLHEWNREVSPAEREACRRVGGLVRQGVALTTEDEAVKAQALRYDEAALRDGLAALL